MLASEIAGSSPNSVSVQRKLLKNALANVVSGASSALVALSLPFALSRSLSKGEFGAWALALQIASYTAFFGFGIQTAVGRFIAVSQEKSDFRYGFSILSSAFFVLCVMALVATSFSIAGALTLPHFFPAWPQDLLRAGSQALLVIGPSLAIGLPLTAINGYFVGLQRNDIPAATIGFSRLFLVIAVVAAAYSTKNLYAMAAAYAVVNLITYAVQWEIFRRVAGKGSLSISAVTRSTLTALGGYCASLTVWSVAMLMVNGLSTLLVGRFEFSATALFSSSQNMITVLAGIQQALFSPILAVASGMFARNARNELDGLFIRSSRLSLLLLLLVGSAAALASGPIMRVWLGPSYVHEGHSVLQLLILANIVRLSLTPYALLLLATGQHRLCLASALGEGLVNLSVSIVAGQHFGAIGVALGTLVGGCFGVGMHYFYNMPRTQAVCLDRRTWLLRSIIKSLSCFLPIIPAIILVETQVGVAVTILSILAWILSALGCWRYALDENDRADLTRIAHKIRTVVTRQKR